jgi:hypothetical protein
VETKPTSTGIANVAAFVGPGMTATTAKKAAGKLTRQTDVPCDF